MERREAEEGEKRERYKMREIEEGQGRENRMKKMKGGQERGRKRGGERQILRGSQNHFG